MAASETTETTESPSPARLVIARVRMPLLAAAGAALVVGPLAGLPPVLVWACFGLMVVAFAFYIRLGTPTGAVADLHVPVSGRWMALNSPTTRVPSHGLHGWAQTYAVDLVHDPAGGGRPGFGWSPVARRPEDFPAFGRPVLAPVSGEVVRTRSGWRDHWSRTSWPAFAWMLVESARELLGPSGIVGNHVVIRADDGTYVMLAHLRRRSVRARRGERVEAGQVVAECGNSGNSSEPHLHVQAMDRASLWVASARPLRFDGAPPPANGEHLDAA